MVAHMIWNLHITVGKRWSRMTRQGITVHEWSDTMKAAQAVHSVCGWYRVRVQVIQGFQRRHFSLALDSFHVWFRSLCLFHILPRVFWMLIPGGSCLHLWIQSWPSQHALHNYSSAIDNCTQSLIDSLELPHSTLWLPVEVRGCCEEHAPLQKNVGETKTQKSVMRFNKWSLFRCEMRRCRVYWSLSLPLWPDCVLRLLSVDICFIYTISFWSQDRESLNQSFIIHYQIKKTKHRLECATFTPLSPSTLRVLLTYTT